ncbi:MAG: hypothetical protein R2742_06340 [Micropruina glycogenica]
MEDILAEKILFHRHSPR